jgi:hypothetical protein
VSGFSAAAKFKRGNFITPAKERATAHLKPGQRFALRHIPRQLPPTNHFEILIRVSHLGGV